MYETKLPCIETLSKIEIRYILKVLSKKFWLFNKNANRFKKNINMKIFLPQKAHIVLRYKNIKNSFRCPINDNTATI